MQLDGAAADEIHRVMVGVAAHEHEEVVDPVGDAKAEHLGIELRRLLRIFDDEGDMAEFQWPDAVMLQMLAEVAPSLNSSMVVPLLSLNVSTGPMPGMVSLRSS